MLGNFPQAFSHVALVNSAFALQKAETADPDGEDENDGMSPEIEIIEDQEGGN